MNTENIKSLSDFKSERKKLDKEIEFAHKMLEVNISSLRYQFMPTQMVQNIWNNLGDKFMNWVEKKLE